MEYASTRQTAGIISIRVEIIRHGSAAVARVDGQPATIRTVPEGLDLSRLAERLAMRAAVLVDRYWEAGRYDIDPAEVVAGDWAEAVASLAW